MENKQIISTCGLVCNECEFYGNKCSGCYAVKGSTFWANEMMPTKVCPLFDCSVNERGYHSCGNCAELPCSTFVQMKDPNITKEEHIRMLSVRQELLKKNLN
jgi:hypothetical protein